jgi:hypothetical protein
MIDISSALSSCCSKLSGAFDSPLWTAIIITLILFIVIVFAYPAKRNTPVATFVKFILYAFAIIFGGVFIHSLAVETRFKAKHENVAANQMIGGLDSHIQGNITPCNVRLPSPPVYNAVSNINNIQNITESKETNIDKALGLI